MQNRRIENIGIIHELMTTPLNAAEQDRVIANTIELTLDNLSLAWHVAGLLIEYSSASLPPPQATVSLGSVHIPGKNCGFFTTPVIQMAILDCRKTLEFFGLTCESKSHAIVPLDKRRKDDLGIEHFGLPWATKTQLIGQSSAMIPVPLEMQLAKVHHWSNKQLAHFTLSDPKIKLDAIRDVCKAMIDAYQRLLFDALGRPRPRIQPVNSQIP